MNCRDVASDACCTGDIETRRSADPHIWNVVAYEIHSVNLLLTSAACRRETWVTVDRGLHVAKIQQPDRQWYAERSPRQIPANPCLARNVTTCREPRDPINPRTHKLRP